MLHPTSPSARRCLLWDEVLSTTVRSCVFIQHKSLTFCFCFVATSRFTDFLRTLHYVLWQLWQLVVTRFVITFIGWMFLNILFRFQDSTHPEQLCLPLTVLRMMWWPLRPWPGGLCLYWLLQEWTPMSGSLTQLGLPQLSTIGDISLSYRFIKLVTIQWCLP